jgi:hypothetical protein
VTRRAIVIAAGVGLAVVAAFYVGSSRRPTERRTPGPTGPAGPAARPTPEPTAPAAPRRAEEPRRAPRPRGRPAPPPEAPAPPPAEPAPTATLTVESDVPGASVFLDRQYVGVAPTTITGIQPGTHRLNVSAAGYEGYAETIAIEPGERTITVRFKDVRLDAALEVVHKHRFGACRGRLVASPAGLRYETTDRDDAFSAALEALEVFEVDYLQKNLRIKPRGGKTYNFTEPEGNADRLFVFHREVDKARARLRQRDRP